MKHLLLLAALLGAIALPGAALAAGEEPAHAVRQERNPDNYLVRLSLITVDAERLDEYRAFLQEGVQASMAREPGVLVLYPTFRKDAPNKVAILEIYESQEAYQAHIRSAHFQKYKQGTLDMVESLELVDTDALFPDLKIK